MNDRSNTATGRGVVLLVCLLLAACGTPTTDERPTSEAGKAPAVESGGREAPDFTLQAVDGSQLTLSGLDGRVRLIDFWATWCAPCREEIPMFKELQERYGERGFTILAISDESSGVIKEFVDSHEINYPNLIDPGEVSDDYGVLALPSAYLIDHEGTIVETFMGPKPRKILEAKIVDLLEALPET